MTRDTEKLLMGLGIAAGALVIGIVFWPKPAAASGKPGRQLTWDVPSATIMNMIDGALSGGAVGPGNQVNLQTNGKSVTVVVDKNEPWVGQQGAHGWTYNGHVIRSLDPFVTVGTTVVFGDQNIFALLGGGDSVNATNPVQ
jgi:hypothetical protein